MYKLFKNQCDIFFVSKSITVFINLDPVISCVGFYPGELIQCVENNTDEDIHGNILIKKAAVGSYSNIPQIGHWLNNIWYTDI